MQYHGLDVKKIVGFLGSGLRCVMLYYCRNIPSTKWCPPKMYFAPFLIQVKYIFFVFDFCRKQIEKKVLKTNIRQKIA